MVEFSNPSGYEQWMGRWSKRLAPSVVAFAKLPQDSRLLDVGSGTGALCNELLRRFVACTVVGVEPAEAYVSYCREAFSDDRLSFEVGNASAIPYADNCFDATLSLLILQEVTDVPRALSEMRRVTRPGGSVVASQWDFANGMPMLEHFWEAAVEVLATESVRQAAADCMVVDYPDDVALVNAWRTAGFTKIQTARHPVDMTFTSFEDYWSPFLSNVTPTSSYAGELEPDQLQELESRLRARVVGSGPDQGFTLTAHAWAIQGRVPTD